MIKKKVRKQKTMGYLVYLSKTSDTPTGALGDVSVPAFPGQTATKISVIQDRIPEAMSPSLEAGHVYSGAALQSKPFGQTQIPIRAQTPFGQPTVGIRQGPSMGFDPNGVQPESGFKPITSKVSSLIFTDAFMVLRNRNAK